MLGAYLGADAAERVLNGRIRRHDVENLTCVVWMSDLRGFTSLSDRLAADDLLELLGAYFSIVVGAVRAEGGEVLKFIDDAVLAVFRVDDRSITDSCEAAARAAQAVGAAIADANVARQRDGKEAILHGLGLHFGDVVYGNVGSADRLDFTVIGPAVNMVSRIEALCRPLNRQVLLSEAFASVLRRPTECLGAFELKGLPEPEKIYSLDLP